MTYGRTAFGSILLLFVTSAFAQLPRTMAYQGRLADADGHVITDTTDSGCGCAGRLLGFFITDADSNLLWADTLCVRIVSGYFDVRLDLSANGGDSLKFGRPYYVQLMVDGNDDCDLSDPEDELLTPREKIVPVLFSMRSVYSDTADYYVVRHDSTLSGAGTQDSPLSVSSTALGDCCPSGVLKPFKDRTPRPGWTYAGFYQAYGGWERKANMPTARYWFGYAAVDGKIYIMGGRTTTTVGTNECYDPATNSWTTACVMLSPNCRFAAAAVGGKIYALGGDDGSYSNRNEEYDPSTDSWTSKTSMPTARLGVAADTAEGKIYVFGGASSTGYLAITEEYDPSSDSWATRASAPTARYYLTAAACGGKIYVIGGESASGEVGANEEYDPTTDSWTVKAPLPVPCSQSGAAELGGKIYVIGGLSEGDPLDINYCYDPSTDSWSSESPLPTARRGLCVISVGGGIYAIGGYGEGGRTAVNEKYDPSNAVFFYWFWKD